MEYLRINGRIVGELKDGVYYSNRNYKHFMKKFQGFGISDRIIKVLEDKGCIQVCIRYTSRGGIQTKYNCPLSFFTKSLKTHVFEEGDVQKFVSIKDMNNPNIISKNGQQKFDNFNELDKSRSRKLLK